jgi:lysozyme family protein
MNEQFEKAFKLIIDAEGGFTNNPADHGGPTNWGITQNEINKFLGHTASLEEVKTFPLESAKKIYKAKYWDHMHLDQINNKLLKVLLFDQGVNRGCGTAILSIQRIVGAKADALMDTETIDFINASDHLKTCFKFIEEAQKSYVQICKKNPSQMVFLSGWINRTIKLWELVRESVQLK